MELYNNFLGIDIGKFTFFVATYGSNKAQEYENTSPGIKDFLSDHKKKLSTSLCINGTTLRARGTQKRTLDQ